MLQQLKIITIITLFTLCGNHSVLAQANTGNKNHGLSADQFQTITGRITDQDGFPVPDATVMISTDRSLLTDMDGHFSIPAKEGELLIINAISYNKAEIIIGKNSEYNISIKQELQGTGPPVTVVTFHKRTFFGRIFHSIGNLFRGNSGFSVKVP